MQWTQEHYEQIKHLLPKQRGNVEIDNETFFEAMIHLTENGFSWLYENLAVELKNLQLYCCCQVFRQTVHPRVYMASIYGKTVLTSDILPCILK